MKLWCALLFLMVIASFSIAQVPANQTAPDGYLPQHIRVVDSIVNVFMQKYQVPGLSFAIAQNDSLKLVRSYGYADTTSKQLVQPEHRFRIASVSKPFTATAIMLLVEQGKLRLQDKVFGKGAVLGTKFGKLPYKKWVADITIEQLLEHLGGGWGNDGNDPMFMHPEMKQAQLLSFTLNTQPLSHRPGTNFEYSNFGYCILGRVIEKVSGMPYAQFVRKNVLEPSGIRSMEMGGNTFAERKANEVYYYDKDADPYTMDQRRMDSHGGWIATPTDLVKFLVRVDKFPQKTDILQPATLQAMYTAPSVSPYYAKGWAVNKVDNYWHSGSLPGQQSVAVRTHQGFCWALMVNTRKEDNFALDLDQLMWKIKSAIKKWPQNDLFDK